MPVAHFLALQTETGAERNCTFLVQKVSGEFYFFGNALLACMGYDPPDEHMDLMVAKNDQHKLEVASGIYLKEDTVLNLVSFKDFVANYIKDCKSGSLNTRCPQ